MVNYSISNFIIPLSPNDKSIKVRDVNNTVRYELYPYNIISTFTKDNIVVIKTKATDSVIGLDFTTDVEAINALLKLQTAIDIIKSTISNITPDVQHAIDNAISAYNISSRVIFHQITPSMSWAVPHNLNGYPNITVVNEDQEQIVVYIQYVDADNILIGSNQNITGWCYIR